MWRGVAVVSVAASLLLAWPWPTFVSRVAAQQPCRIERVTYRAGGLQIVSWVMKPARDGRFPVVVWSHGAKLPAIVAAPLITESSPCLPFVDSSGWMLFFAEVRGYGGSEGPEPFPAMRADPVGFVQARADDLNAGVEWLITRPDVNPACVASIGWSQGGAAALLATAKQSRLYRATVADAPGIADTLGAWTEMMRSARTIPTPVLIQSNTTDGAVFVEGMRVFVRELQRWGRTVEYKEYTHPSGHLLFNLPASPQLFGIWGADATKFLERAFAGCGR